MARKVDTEQAMHLPETVVERIRADIARHRPGLWAEEVNDGPACLCGARDNSKIATGVAFGGRHHGCARHVDVQEVR